MSVKKVLVRTTITIDFSVSECFAEELCTGKLTPCEQAENAAARIWKPGVEVSVKTERHDAIRKGLKEAIETHTLSAMIEWLDDIEAAVLALEARVPAGCETFAPPRPTASGIQTAYFGNVRVVMAWDVIKGKMIRRADLYYRKSLS